MIFSKRSFRKNGDKLILNFGRILFLFWQVLIHTLKREV